MMEREGKTERRHQAAVFPRPLINDSNTVIVPQSDLIGVMTADVADVSIKMRHNCSTLIIIRNVS